MQLMCTKDDLQKAVSIAEKAIAVRSTIPVISNLLLEATKNQLVLSGYDLEIGIRYKIQAAVKKENTLLISAKTFSGIISKLEAGEINLHQESKGQLKITNQKSLFNVHCLPSDEFPKFPKIEKATQIKFPVKEFKGLIRETILAVSTDESKQVLNGILFDFSKKDLKLVATDGYRLAKSQFVLNEPLKESARLIVPTKALSELNKVLQETGEVIVNFNKEYISFEWENLFFVSRLIQGQFPDYNQVIPEKVENKVYVNRKELIGACERSAIIASESANIVHVEVSDGQLHITANTPGVGNSSELLNVSADGKKFPSAAFNVRLILDALKIIDEDEVMLGLTGNLSPGVIQPKNTADYTYVVMPIKTTEPVPA